jgi:hypothetical protein
LRIEFENTNYFKFNIKKMDTNDAPQIIEHVGKSINFTPFDVKWIPSSARFILFG